MGGALALVGKGMSGSARLRQTATIPRPALIRNEELFLS